MGNTYRETIKYNCDVSDAKFWGYFSICGLLLRYRDLYRSEKGLKVWTNIDRKEIAAWISEKEARWPELETGNFRDLAIDGKSYEPFDGEAINKALEPQGLVYGAGYGMYLKPTFFLAELKSIRKVSGLTVYTTGKEYVRDLFTASAMLQNETVLLRLEPLMILLHYRYSELNAKRNAALEDAFSHYGFRNRQLMDDTFEKRLEGLVARYAEIILQHEIAEHHEESPVWREILAAAGDRKNELYLRALKDLIADTSGNGPLMRIVDTRDRGALGLSIALMEGFQRKLFPEIRHAYAEFLKHEDWDALDAVRRAGYERLIVDRERVHRLYEESEGGGDFSDRLKTMLPV